MIADVFAFLAFLLMIYVTKWVMGQKKAEQYGRDGRWDDGLDEGPGDDNEEDSKDE